MSIVEGRHAIHVSRGWSAYKIKTARVEGVEVTDVKSLVVMTNYAMVKRPMQIVVEAALDAVMDSSAMRIATV